MLYSSGTPGIIDAIQFSLQSDFTAYLPVFTLTCISTGGPATTVTWTRDGATVSYDDSHTLMQTVTDQATSTYSNVLTVTGREPGNYQCTVANERGNSSSEMMTIHGV